MLGGVIDANQALTNLVNVVPSNATAAATATGFTGWTTMPSLGSPFWWTLVSSLILGVGIGVLSQPQLVVRFMTVKSHRELNRAVLIGGVFIFAITFGAYVVGSLSNVYFFQTTGQTAVQAAGGNLDKVIPTFIAAAMPLWFTYLFMVALLSAAMSTLSAQFHVQGTAFGRDIYETLVRKTGGSSVRMARIGIVIAVLIAVVMGFILPSSIVALGTSLWFGITAAAFLSIYVAAIYWKRATKEGAIAGLVSGALVSLFWLLFGFKKTADPMGISKALIGQSTIITSVPWPTVDPMIIALPVAVVVTIVVSLLTKPPEKEFIDKCFQGVGRLKGK